MSIFVPLSGCFDRNCSVYMLKLVIVLSPVLLLVFRIASGIWVPLCFCVNFSVFFKDIFLSFHFHLCVSVSMRQQIDGSSFDPFNPIYIFWLLNLCHLHSVLILKVTFVHLKNILSFFFALNSFCMFSVWFSAFIFVIMVINFH